VTVKKTSDHRLQTLQSLKKEIYGCGTMRINHKGFLQKLKEYIKKGLL
jgi:hypothetical protein